MSNTPISSTRYVLNYGQYTLKNALSWGNCQGHWKLAREGSLGKRTVIHYLIAIVEAPPIIGRIASLFETAIVLYFKLSVKEKTNNTPISKHRISDMKDKGLATGKNFTLQNPTLDKHQDEIDTEGVNQGVINAVKHSDQSQVISDNQNDFLKSMREIEPPLLFYFLLGTEGVKNDKESDNQTFKSITNNLLQRDDITAKVKKETLILLFNLDNKEDVNDFLGYAAEIGHQPLVEFLLTLEEVNSKGIISAFLTASAEGHSTLVKLLLDRYRFLSPKKTRFTRPTRLENTAEEAFLLASEGGHLDILKVLMDRKIIKTDKIGEALVIGAQGANLPMVKLLTDQEGISQIYKTQAFYTANCKNVDVIKFLIEQEEIEEESINGLLADAIVSNNKEAVLKFLIDRDEINPETIRQSFRQANIFSIKFLIERDEITPEDIVQAFRYAAISSLNYDNKEIVEFLINRDEINAQEVIQAFRRGSIRGSNRVIEFLIDQVEISSDEINQALRNVVREDIENPNVCNGVIKGRKDVINFLINREEITNEILLQVVVPWAVRYRYGDYVPLPRVLKKIRLRNPLITIQDIIRESGARSSFAFIKEVLDRQIIKEKDLESFGTTGKYTQDAPLEKRNKEFELPFGVMKIIASFTDGYNVVKGGACSKTKEDELLIELMEK